MASDLIIRIPEHKNKIRKGFTSKYNINKLVYSEVFDRMEDAIAREKELKGWKRQWKIELIEKNNPEWKDLFDDLLE